LSAIHSGVNISNKPMPMWGGTQVGKKSRAEYRAAPGSARVRVVCCGGCQEGRREHSSGVLLGGWPEPASEWKPASSPRGSEAANSDLTERPIDVTGVQRGLAGFRSRKPASFANPPDSAYGGMGRTPKVAKPPASYQRLADLLSQIESLVQSDESAKWSEAQIADAQRHIARIERAFRVALMGRPIYRRLADLLDQIELLVQADDPAKWSEVLIADAQHRIARIERAFRKGLVQRGVGNMTHRSEG
jgi:hypothetical protein